MTHLRSIGIYGSSSGRNAGDAALISGIMEGVDKALGRRLLYGIPTYRPDYIWFEYQNKTRPASMLPWHGSFGMFGFPTWRSFARCDLNLIYDNMLFDRKLWNQLFNYMPAVWYYFTKRRRPGQLLGMYNVGVGPVTTPRGRMMLGEIAHACDLISVRDEDSKNLLVELGIQPEQILLTADAALTVEPCSLERVSEILRESNLELGSEMLAVNVNSYLGSWSGSKRGGTNASFFVKSYGEALTRLAEETKARLVFVTTQHSDIKITEEVRKAVKTSQPTYLLTNKMYNHSEMKGVLGAMSFLFAMRLHANILATSMLTPAVALSFQKKVSSYYSELGLPQNILSFDDFSSDSLYEHAKKGWEQRHEIRRHLERRIPELQRKSLVTAEVIALIDKQAGVEEALQFGQRRLRELNDQAVVNRHTSSVKQEPVGEEAGFSQAS
jgi:polysaccharide pyruvyl transferase WcaK-like protein